MIAEIERIESKDLGTLAMPGELANGPLLPPDEDLSVSIFVAGEGKAAEDSRTPKPAAQEFAQAAGMRPATTRGQCSEHCPDKVIADGGAVIGEASNGSEEISGGCRASDDAWGTHGTNGACATFGGAACDCVQSTVEEPGRPADLSESGRGQPHSKACGAEAVVILQDAGIGEPPDEWRISEANRRKQILETFDSLVAQGTSKAEAAKQVATGYATIWRWQQRRAEKGFNGLLPETERCGRKPVWRQIGLTDEQFEQIKAELQGLNLDLKSGTATLRAYANSDRCPPELAAVILDPNRCSKHALPPSLRDAAKNNDALDKAHEGPRALALRGAWTPRRMDVLPGDIFTADDTTPIWAWWVPWQESEEYPFGVKLLQGQFIPVMDVASQCVVSYVLIAREKSSYRACDIWHLFGHTFDVVGLPRLGWQLERGSWEANIIRGAEVEYREREVTMSRRLGGLRQLPTNATAWHREKLQGVEFPKTLQTWTSYLPKSKSIEAWFKRNQGFEGTLWGALGRDQMRRPFEKAKKLFQECQRGTRDPREHFLSGTEMAARLNGIIRYVNNEPMEGEVFKGIPIVNFESAVREQPLFHVEPELQWLYRRDWAVTQISGYFVRARLTEPTSGERYSLFYANPEVFAKHSGEEVAVYFDREQFEKPAQIILAKTGEFLCEAHYEERKGSFLDETTAHDMRKRWKNAVMSVYGTLVKHAPSRQVPPEIAQRRAAAKETVKAAEDSRTPKPAALETVTIDRRPGLPGQGNAVASPGASSVSAAVLAGRANMEKQRNRLSQQAAIAARLRSLRGED